ncbi:IclR family transcriptional regulator [Halorubrum sp. AD140]|uniref:IclR family transcriptional regulator n=1 Tax=Halorubrum sp. AD140 TaxID=3050073 RepID=UPI002ACC9CAD|nr:IclR family transcriptional regulator [Halorubrum sp. AD140]MDZ5809961.1 IclR family transcriptional regulator [Halorubrum sp. AD140]
MDRPKTSSVRATGTSMRILTAIADREEAVSIAELVDRLELAKSTVYKHLITLEEHGIVVKNGGGYRLGLRCLEFGGIARQYDGVYDVAKPEVRKLAAETGELANLLFEEQGLGIYVYTARGERAIDFDVHAGRRVYLHTTALGKALLASLSDDRVDEIIDRHGLPAETDETITTRSALFEELDRIREEGFAYNEEERLGGIGCVGTPLETGERRNAAISIMTPISRLQPEDERRAYTESLHQTANVIEVNLAHGRP